jgi:hypothetical protein
MRKLTRQLCVSALMIIVVALAFASKGGGSKKKTPSYKNDFVPIRTTNGFALRSGVNYTGSRVFGVEKNDKGFSYNTIVTYQKGNTIFIMPYKYKVNTSVFSAGPAKSNLQVLDLKIKIHK